MLCANSSRAGNGLGIRLSSVGSARVRSSLDSASTESSSVCVQLSHAEKITFMKMLVSGDVRREFGYKIEKKLLEF